MRNVRIVANGGTGAMLMVVDPIQRVEVIGIGLNEKEEVLALQKSLNEFVEKNYKAE